MTITKYPKRDFFLTQGCLEMDNYGYMNTFGTVLVDYRLRMEDSINMRCVLLIDVETVVSRF
jgi:hypothetical protein